MSFHSSHYYFIYPKSKNMFKMANTYILIVCIVTTLLVHCKYSKYIHNIFKYKYKYIHKAEIGLKYKYKYGKIVLKCP